jgi:hypothetical protein
LTTFINLLKQTFGKILSNKGSISEEERQIIAECLNIWISLITYDPSRLIELYNDGAYLELFVGQGLLSENQMLRQQFKEAIEYVALRIKQGDLP